MAASRLRWTATVSAPNVATSAPIVSITFHVLAHTLLPISASIFHARDSRHEVRLSEHVASVIRDTVLQSAASGLLSNPILDGRTSSLVE